MEDVDFEKDNITEEMFYDLFISILNTEIDDFKVDKLQEIVNKVFNQDFGKERKGNFMQNFFKNADIFYNEQDTYKAQEVLKLACGLKGNLKYFDFDKYTKTKMLMT